MSRGRHNELSTSELLSDNSGNWLVDNMVRPALNTAVLEPYNAVAHTINGAADTIGIEGELPKANTKMHSARLWTKEWYAQNLSSGLAMTVPYGIAAVLTGRGLHRIGKAMGAEGTTAAFLKSRHTSMILGAGAYDAFRVPHEGETRLGNALGGMLGFGVFEAGNHGIKNWSTAKQIPARMLVGMVGAVSHQSLSHLISNGKLPESDKLWEAALAGGTMNIALPYAHRGIERGINEISHAFGRAVPLESHLRAKFGDAPQEMSPLLDQLVQENPWVLVQERATQTALHADRQIVQLKSGQNSPADIGHELSHSSSRRSPQAEAGYSNASDHLRAGRVNEAWESYRDTRLAQEVLAINSEQQIRQDLGGPQMKTVAPSDVLSRMADSSRTYEQVWRQEFEQFQKSDGAYRPQQDFAGWSKWEENYYHYDRLPKADCVAMARNIGKASRYWQGDLAERMLQDSDPAVRLTLLDNMHAMEPMERIHLFNRALEHPDYNTRLAAVDRIRHLPEEARVTAIEDAIVRGDIIEYPTDPRLVERYGVEDARARFAPDISTETHGAVADTLGKSGAKALVEQLAGVTDSDAALRLWDTMFADSRMRRVAVENLAALPPGARTRAWWKAWEASNSASGDILLNMQKELGGSIKLLLPADRAKAYDAFKFSFNYERQPNSRPESTKKPAPIDWSNTARDYSKLSANEKVQVAERLKECPEHGRSALWDRMIGDTEPTVRFAAVEAIASLQPGQQSRAWYRAVGDGDYNTRLVAISRICELPAGERQSAWRHVMNHRAAMELPISEELLAKYKGRTEHARAVPDIPENTPKHVRKTISKGADDLLVEQIASLPGVESRESAWRAALADKRTSNAAMQNFSVLPESSRGTLWMEAWNMNLGPKPREPVQETYRNPWDGTSHGFNRPVTVFFGGKAEGLSVLLTQAVKLPAQDRIRAWDAYVDLVTRYKHSTSIDNIRAVELLASLPENVQSTPRTRLGEWYRLLDEFKKWNETEPDAYVRRTKLERADMGVSSLVAALPEHHRADAWHAAYEVLGVQRLPKLADAVAYLPPEARLNAFARMAREAPCAEVNKALEDAVRSLPENSLVDATNVILNSHLGAARGPVLAKMPFYRLPAGPLEYIADVNTKIMRAIEKNGEIAPEHVRTVWEELAEFHDESNPDLMPVKAKLASELSPDFLSQLLFDAADADVGRRFAKAHPDIVRKLAGGFTGYGDPPGVVGNSMQVWLATGSLRLAAEVGEAVFNKAGKKEDMHETRFARLMEELAPLAEPSDRTALLRNLGDRILTSSGEDAAALLQLGVKMGKPDHESLRVNILSPLEHALGDRGRDYAWRLSMAREAGRVVREGDFPTDLLVLPDMRMKGVELPASKRDELRQTAENALMNPELLAAVLNEGPLGTTFPGVFGPHEKGGIVGRPQHGGHEFPMDEHSILVVQRVRENPEFATLSPKDQINVLWAALLHDTGKRAAMSDPGHEWASANIAWGVLETMGYPPERIQRIANLISRHTELSFNPKVRQTETLKDDKKAMELAVFYRHPSALQQLRILNEADIRSINSGSTFWTPDVQAELRGVGAMVQKQRKILDNSTVPVLTTALPRQAGLFSLAPDYAVLAHASHYLDSAFLRQLSLIESPEYSMSSSLLTPRHQELYWKDASVVAIVTGPAEHVAQLDRTNLGTGRNVDWERHVKLARETVKDRPKFVSEIDERVARLSRAVGGPATLQNLWRTLSQFDNLSELSLRGPDDPLVQSYNQIVQALTSTRTGLPLKEHNEIKLLNPKVVGIGLLRRGRPVFLDAATPGDLLRLSPEGNNPSWLSTTPAPPNNSLLIPRTVWQEALNRNLPIVSLE